MAVRPKTFKRTGTAQHVANIIPTMEHGKKSNQFNIESFQAKEWSLNTSQCTLQTDTAKHDDTDAYRCKFQPVINQKTFSQIQIIL